MSDVELVEFKKYEKETLVSINVAIPNEDAAMFMDWWYNKVEKCQAPLIETTKYGMHLHIPWILKEDS